MEMKYKFLAIIFLLLFGLVNISAAPEEFATGSAVSEPFDVSVEVSSAIPYLRITKPVAGDVYITSKNIPLEYTSANDEYMWYNIDLGQNKPVKEIFNASPGLHTLYLYANNSLGMTVESVDFSVRPEELKIEYGEIFSDDLGNATTDFNQSSLSELQNLHGIIIDKLSAGKISFLEGINVTDDLDPTDNFVDIDSNIKISFNRIEINSVNLPNFNKSAELTLYGLSFLNPRILKDGKSCSDCSLVSYNYQTGDLKFIVNSFSVYSAAETVVEVPVVTSRGGGGSSTREIIIETTSTEDNFLIDKSLLKIFITHGGFVEKEIVITNKNEFDIEFTLEIRSEQSFMNFEGHTFNIKAGESKTIGLEFLGKENAKPGLYFGEIVFRAEDLNKELYFILQLSPKKSLFDVLVTIPDEFMVSRPGGHVFFKVGLLNMGQKEKEDVIMETSVFDEWGKSIFFKKESFAVHASAERLGEFTVPMDAVEGEYFIFVKVDYSGSIAVASSGFFVKDSLSIPSKENIFLILVLISLIIFWILHQRRHKKKKKKKKVKK